MACTRVSSEGDHDDLHPVYTPEALQRVEKAVYVPESLQQIEKAAMRDIRRGLLDVIVACLLDHINACCHGCYAVSSLLLVFIIVLCLI